MIEPDDISLLRAIREDPEDDAPRLAYADWLNEHDGLIEETCTQCNERGLVDPKSVWDGTSRTVDNTCPVCEGNKKLVRSNHLAERAELIRAQIELVRLDSLRIIGDDGMVFGWRRKKERDRSDKLQKRVRELLEQFGEQWARDELVRPCGLDSGNALSISVGNDGLSAGILSDRQDVRWRWVRGLIGMVECRTDTLMGPACGRCGGYGVINFDTSAAIEAIDQPDTPIENRICNACQGKRRLFGIARLLGENVPVMRVALSDAEVRYGGRGNGGRRTYYFDDQWMFPQEYRVQLMGLPSVAAVNLAIACVAASYCRDLAGLKSLCSLNLAMYSE